MATHEAVCELVNRWVRLGRDPGLHREPQALI
jgi:hypothetical protein